MENPLNPLWDKNIRKLYGHTDRVKYRIAPFPKNCINQLRQATMTLDTSFSMVLMQCWIHIFTNLLISLEFVLSFFLVSNLVLSELSLNYSTIYYLFTIKFFY